MAMPSLNTQNKNNYKHNVILATHKPGAVEMSNCKVTVTLLDIYFLCLLFALTFWYKKKCFFTDTDARSGSENGSPCLHKWKIYSHGSL